MNRAERLAQAERLAREQLDRQRQRLAKVQVAQREEERKDLHKRRVLVGTLVLDTPLASLDDQTLQGLFHVLAGLVETPDPVALLEGLLSDVGGTPGTSLPGFAHRGGGVTAVQ